jgi:uncharacterized protein YecT (DUF1311 family)
MKKTIYFPFLFTLILFSGCMKQPEQTIVITYEVTREITNVITRIYLVTPITTPTSTKTESCYDTALTQYDLNQCAGLHAEEAKKKMKILIDLIVEKYSEKPDKVEEFLKLQKEWEDLAYDECQLWYGRFITDPNTGNEYYENGSMAPMLMAGCLETKYTDRSKELQWLLDF